MRDHYIVSYDISDPKRLRRVHATCRDFGDALQLSVFSCQLTTKDLAVLESRLHDAIDHRQDQVLVIKLGRADSYAGGFVFASVEDASRFLADRGLDGTHMVVGVLADWDNDTEMEAGAPYRRLTRDAEIVRP